MTPKKAESTTHIPEPKPFEGLVVGRIVHYWPDAAEYNQTKDRGPWAAIVTKVGLSGLITLNVQIPVPLPIGVDPVQRRERIEYTVDARSGCWSWMFEGQGTRYRSNPPSALPEMTA